MRTSMLAGALCLLVLGCQEPQRGQAPGTDQKREEVPGAAQEKDLPAQAPPPAAQPPAARERETAAREAPQGSLLHCRPGAEIEQTATRLIEMADANEDGQVSKDEAQALASFVVGGFFFRSDTDGDGVVTPAEGKAARAELQSRYPAMASLFRGVRGATGESPFATLAKLLDVEYGKPLSMPEARDAARSAVNDLYSAVDADRDRMISAAEVRSAARQATRALAQAAFRAADSDRNGSLSLPELQGALQASAKVAFPMADTNGDGQLGEDEARAAMVRIAEALGAPPSAMQPAEAQKGPPAIQ